MTPSPGCFGIPSVFSFRSQHCSRCAAHREACQRQVLDTLRGMDQGIDAVRVALIEHERAVGLSSRAPLQVQGRGSYVAKSPRFELTDAQQLTAAALPKKARARLEKLLRGGYDVLIRMAIKSGDLAFSKINNQRSLVTALQLLASNPAITRGGLRAAYVGTLGWSDLSAKNEVSIMWQVLPGLGIAVQNSASLALSPELRA